MGGQNGRMKAKAITIKLRSNTVAMYVTGTSTQNTIYMNFHLPLYHKTLRMYFQMNKPTFIVFSTKVAILNRHSEVLLNKNYSRFEKLKLHYTEIHMSQKKKEVKKGQKLSNTSLNSARNHLFYCLRL